MPKFEVEVTFETTQTIAVVADREADAATAAVTQWRDSFKETWDASDAPVAFDLDVIAEEVR